jgi:hypothetical protein
VWITPKQNTKTHKKNQKGEEILKFRVKALVCCFLPLHYTLQHTQCQQYSKIQIKEYMVKEKKTASSFLFASIINILLHICFKWLAHYISS